MKYTVYILYSVTSKKHYTGYTSDLNKRLVSHNVLDHCWTSRHRPWKLVFKKDFDTKAEAMDYEKWLKTGAGRDFTYSISHLENG